MDRQTASSEKVPSKRSSVVACNVWQRTHTHIVTLGVCTVANRRNRPSTASSRKAVGSIEKLRTMKPLSPSLPRLCYTPLARTTGDLSASRSNIAVDWSGLPCASEPERPACHSSSSSCTNGAERERLLLVTCEHTLGPLLLLCCCCCCFWTDRQDSHSGDTQGLILVLDSSGR